MRKLFLASFSFTTGNEKYDEYDLIAIQMDPKDRVIPESAYDYFRSWFLVEYPASKLLSIVILPGIGHGVSAHVPYPHSLPSHTKNLFGDTVWGFKTAESVPMGNTTDTDCSVDVLVDLTGERRFFSVGWFDHRDGEWKFDDEKSQRMFDMKNMKWTYLPLTH